MSIIFFEGFNDSQSDSLKLDRNYWSSNNLSGISFDTGRTGNQIFLSNRPVNSGLSLNTTITLQNFIDPLIEKNAFGIGFYGNLFGLRTNNNNAPSPYAENFLSFYNGGIEVLRIDIIKTVYQSTNSAGFGIYQNNSLIDTYDFKSVSGYSWLVTTDPVYNITYLNNEYYIEFYIDAKNSRQIGIRLTANNTTETFLRNSSNNIYTNITGFDNLTSIKFHGNNDSLGSSSYPRSIDDLYFRSGDNLTECLLGSNTKIYRLNLSGDGTTQDWTGSYGGYTSSSSYSYIYNNDGDTNVIYSSNSGDKAIFEINNIPSPSPSGVGGIKLINIAKKQVSSRDSKFINIITSGNNTTDFNCGNEYNLNSDIYSHKTQFLFNNPITGSGWSKQEINDMQIGVKLL